MKGFEEFIQSFGFREGPFIIAILCIVVLLSNFTGGLIGNIMLAMIGAQIGYLTYKKTIDELKSEDYAIEWRQGSEGMAADPGG